MDYFLKRYFRERYVYIEVKIVRMRNKPWAMDFLKENSHIVDIDGSYKNNIKTFFNKKLRLKGLFFKENLVYLHCQMKMTRI